MTDRDDLYTDPLWVDVALSGGGYRATAWGFGTTLALLRARDQTDNGSPELRIASIASVSGGSIANGVIAQEIEDLNTTDEAGFLEAVRPCVANMAGDGLIPGEPTRRYLWGLAAVALFALLTTLIVAGVLISADRDWGGGAFIVPVIALGAAALVFGIWRRARGAAVAVKPLAIQTAGAAVAGAVLGLGLWLGTALDGWPATRLVILIAVLSGLLWWIALGMFAARGRIVENRLAGLFFSTDSGRPTRLSDLTNRAVHHVFCATELQSGDHIYLTPKLLHGFLLGETARPTIPLAQAVQASASLPGGFPPQETELLRAVELDRPWNVPDDAPVPPVRRIVLADGGVYDNMGEEWSFGFARRTQRSDLVRDSQPAAHFMVVSNAGKALGWSNMRPTNKVWREIRGLIRDQGIQYDATTAQRRRGIVASFRAGEATGQGPIGVIVHMGTSPVAICNQFKNSPIAEQRTRAREALDVLESPEYWDGVVERNKTVGTVLSALDGDTLLDLLEHSTVLTMAALYVVHDIGAVRFPSRQELRTLFGL
jgi:hypothetical protein